MYFLLNMGAYSTAMLVYQRVELSLVVHSTIYDGFDCLDTSLGFFGVIRQISESSTIIILFDFTVAIYLYTLPETNIAPENGWLED